MPENILENLFQLKINMKSVVPAILSFNKSFQYGPLGSDRFLCAFAPQNLVLTYIPVQI